MNHVWLTDGPVDDLAERVAGIIIDDPATQPGVDREVEAATEGGDRRAVPVPAHARRHHRSTGEITCPALVVHGTEDTAISMDRAEILAAGLPGAGQVVRVGGAHAANLTNPEPVNAAIVDVPRRARRVNGDR